MKDIANCYDGFHLSPAELNNGVNTPVPNIPLGSEPVPNSYPPTYYLM